MTMHDFEVVPLGQVLAEIERATALQALQAVAVLLGDVRPCRRCGVRLLSFTRAGLHLVYTADTGAPHAVDCAHFSAGTMPAVQPPAEPASEKK